MKLMETNPVHLITESEEDEAMDRIVDKKAMYSKGKVVSIVEKYRERGYHIDAFAIYASFEGLSVREIAMLRKKDVGAPYLYIQTREYPLFEMDDYLAELCKKAIETDSIMVSYPNSSERRTLLTDSPYVVRFAERKTQTFNEDSQYRSTLAKFTRFMDDTGINHKCLYENGFIYHFNEEQIEFKRSSNKFRGILQKYNMQSSKAKSLIRSGLT